LFRVKPTLLISPFNIIQPFPVYTPLLQTLPFSFMPFHFNFATIKQKKKIAPSQLPTFDNYGLSDDILNQLKDQEILTPTPIQTMVLSEFMRSNKHLVFASQTGTGKTLAYVIPILQKLKEEEMIAKTALTQPN